jgi:hypothetical protein
MYMSDTEPFNIPYMARVLAMRKKAQRGTILVLGSRTGSLFRSGDFFEILKQYGDPSFQDLPHIKQFAQCYHLLTRKFGARDIEMILTKALGMVGEIDADICLAELTKLGLFDIIITTNMDDLLEDSFKYIGMKEKQDFQIFSMHDGAGERLLQLERKPIPQIVKVFGQITTGEYKVMRSGYLGQNRELRGFLEDKFSGDLIIIGLDPVWDAELYQAFPLQGDRFWFINEEVLDESSPLFQIGNARSSAYFLGEEGNYQYFLPELQKSIFQEMSITPLLDFHMNRSILRELYQFRSEFRSELKNAHEFRNEVKSEFQQLRDGLRDNRTSL